MTTEFRNCLSWAREHDQTPTPEYGKPARATLQAAIGEETKMPDIADPLASFIEAACVPLDSGHSSGTLESAEAILAAYPEVAGSNILAAAILGDDESVRRFLAQHPSNANARGGPHGWDALTHLCFSRYLRLDPDRSDGFVRAATALLDAGASANTGWYEKNHQPQPEWESVLYGAAGVAHHVELTRLLLDRGADPNDGEVAYHAPEGWDNRALKVLVESGKLNEDSLATMLLRKADWHDCEGIRLLLARGADPNRMTRWGRTALHQAVQRDNALAIVEVLMNFGADPTLRGGGISPNASAARRGRGDVLELFERRGVPVELAGVERLIAACARNDAAGVRSLVDREPRLIGELLAAGGKLLAEFSGNGNTAGATLLLDLGVDVNAVYGEGDGYFDIARGSRAIHVAAWRARHATVKLLIQRGALVDIPDGRGSTPLALAVRACVDSYWTDRRSPESVLTLLEAGASLVGAKYPSGYTEVDDLLRAAGISA
jgi:ankyrin repeat protein